MAMNNYFQTNIRYEKTLETGTQAKVTESYLVSAMSFTEAEARTIEEMTPFIVGEFEVSAAKKMNISELFFDANGDKWYIAKVMYITLNEKSGTEKSTVSRMLVQASDFQAAVKNLEDGMKGTMIDWEIHSIQESKIVDVFGEKSKTETPGENSETETPSES